MSRLVRIAIGCVMASWIWPIESSAQDTVVVTCAYVTHEGQPVRICNSRGSLMQVVWDCRGSMGSDCRLCGVCHTDANATRAFDLTLHRTRAFPNLTVRPTAPIPWTSDVRIVPDGGRLCAHDRAGRRLHCYPSGALLLRDRAGTPALIVSEQR